MSTPTFVVVAGNYFRLDKIVYVRDSDKRDVTIVKADDGTWIELSIEDGMTLRALLDKAHDLGDITLIEAGDDGCDRGCDRSQEQGSGCCGYGCGACDDGCDQGEDGSGTSPRHEGTDGHTEADSGRPKDDPQGKPKPKLSSSLEPTEGVLNTLGWHWPNFP